MGPGMMSGHDWADMQHQYGQEFNSHWLDAMITIAPPSWRCAGRSSGQEPAR
jgi:hypothetical protein